MDTSSLKNIVVLKDLPSNIVEEAFVVLKENQKIQKLELIDKSKKQNKEQVTDKNVQEQSKKDYIVKEAQMLISDYISKIESKNKIENQSVQILKKKYKKAKILNHILVVGLIFTAIIQFIL